MSDVTQYLQNEVQKAQRTFKIAAISMGVLLVVFAGYFQWLKSELAAVLAPESIAELAINQARAALPDMSEALKSNVQTEAPALVRFALHQAIDRILPLLGQSFDSNLSEQSAALQAAAAEHADQAFAATLAQLKAQRVRNRAKSPVTGEELSSFVAANYAMTLDSATEDALRQRFEQTGGTLKAIDARLALMATNKGASREHELGRRLITTWWTFLDRGQGAKPGAALAESSAKTKH
jgi:hypothetical protein